MDPRERLRMALQGAGCTRCGQPYGVQGIRVLAQREEIAFVQLVCLACQVQTLALVTGIPATGPDDEQRDGARPISEDDVLEMRSFLADYSGDIRAMLDRDLRSPSDDEAGEAR